MPSIIYPLASMALLGRALAVPVAQADATSTGVLAAITNIGNVIDAAAGTLDVCTLDSHDPVSWEPSGASQFMESWFAANGTENWLTAMDDATTSTDGFDSVLDCKPMDSNRCEAPDVPCKDFTPPELRFIRLAATNANQFFSHAHEKLQDSTLRETLRINQIIADFAPDQKAQFNWVSAVAAGFFLLSPIVALFPGAGAVLGGVLAIAGKFDQP